MWARCVRYSSDTLFYRERTFFPFFCALSWTNNSFSVCFKACLFILNGSQFFSKNFFYFFPLRFSMIKIIFWWLLKKSAGKRMKREFLPFSLRYYLLIFFYEFHELFHVVCFRAYTRYICIYLSAATIYLLIFFIPRQPDLWISGRFSSASSFLLSSLVLTCTYWIIRRMTDDLELTLFFQCVSFF